MSLLWARDMTTADIETELCDVSGAIDAFEAADDEDVAHGGSPGEGLYERYEELTRELARRIRRTELMWQPIATAPKDGTRIILWPGCWPATWSNEIRYRDERETGWLIVDCDDPWYTIWSRPDEPTHWMPEPTGPAE